MKINQKKKHRSLLSIIFVIVVLACIYSVFILIQVHFLPCANSISCTKSLTLQIDNTARGVFQNQIIHAPPIYMTQKIDSPSVLGTHNTQNNKHIYVNLATQTLLAYEGDVLFMHAPVSTGLWNKTPEGDFKIWIKLRSTRMTGGSGSDYYNLPNVPYVMYFANNKIPSSKGYGIHGAYWHNNFGHKMSHGCINMKTTDVARLYEWVDPPTTGSITRTLNSQKGTTITIYFDDSQSTPQNTKKHIVDTSDGTKRLMMTTKTDSNYIKYLFYTLQRSEPTQHLVFSKNDIAYDVFTIPQNTWSPDNAHAYIKEVSFVGDNYYVFPASDITQNNLGFINISELFSQEAPDHLITDITGWAGQYLLLINTRTKNEGKKVSFWFNIKNKAFTRLSTYFD